jgi:hypothetical protein
VTFAAFASSSEIWSRSVVCSEPRFGIKGRSLAQKLCFGGSHQHGRNKKPTTATCYSAMTRQVFVTCYHPNVQRHFRQLPICFLSSAWTIGCPDTIQSTISYSNQVVSTTMNHKAPPGYSFVHHSSSVGKQLLVTSIWPSCFQQLWSKTLQRSVPCTTHPTNK